MAFHGMDSEQVAALSQQMATISARVREIETRLTSRIDQVQWAGADRERFLGDWQGAYAGRLRHAAEALDQASQIAGENARQQDSASA
ncbi:hypothetical protein [Nocardioides alkalitolerans]|uniref:hypothetical protein n=1 Tax=Nocardioides alkalitolerans TaxID=281714 RepID=UPI0004916E75|nr:hypothetical protein [Nocardioides alkalitolerans]